jgi:kynurenine formamidase
MKHTGFVSRCAATMLALATITGPPAGRSFAESTVVDLTHAFDESTVYWPTSKTFHLDIVHKGPTEGGFWYESNDISASEHGGTHLDAPAHFFKDRWHVDDIPLDRLIASGIVVDVSEKAEEDPDYLIGKEDFVEWEERHGRIAAGTVVLVRTGWEDRWPNRKLYLGTDRPGDVDHLSFPGFSEEAARFLTAERGVAAVGLDTPSLDHGPSKDFLAHQVFGEANVPGFENVCRLGSLPPTGFRIIALPMKIGRGSGAPLRIVAEVNP